MGLSPNGGMPGSDIAIGWVKDGKAHLTDHYADAKAQPPVDESQDWELVSGYENGTHTVLRFNRKLTTCDEKDRVISEDTLRVIWAWHDQDPDEESGVSGPSYHGSNRGARATRLLQRIVPEQTISTGTTYTHDLLMNNAEPIVQPGNEGTVHHLLVYTCKKNPNMTVRPEGHPGHQCYTPNMPGDWMECYQGSIMLAWAIGSGPIVYPEHVGYPISDDDDSGYVMMEMHYDNPLLASGIRDSSGIRLTYTPELRDNDLGTLEVGGLVSKFHVIPPHVQEFTSAGFCSTRCLNAFLEEHGQPIHIISANLHSHLLGVKLSARLIRDGVEIEIVRDDNYDFNLQYERKLKEELTIYPGGLGTPQEMCETFFMYYPKFNMSSTEYARDIIITAPAHMVNMTYEEAMEAVPWTSENGQIFSEYLLNSTFYSNCQATHQSNVDAGALIGYADRFPRGTKRPTEDICSRSATPTPDPVGGSTALQPQHAAVYTLTAYLLALVITGVN
ncbi:MOXD1 [Branchiostoma lanceolatum]|uniref:MOXD1 protein n=1 Tax=Branchiostoma lanceolatum TaxID=7740 RepID=A0A8J9YX32_BRALA|nr:MOXD1 [Branchiostoma lanceolatum]